MRAMLVIALGLASLFWVDGAGDGRLGNERMAAGDLVGAEEAFASGIAALEEAVHPVRSTLLHNLGLALAAQDQPDEARQAFEDAFSADPAREAQARAAHSAGTLALERDDYQSARRWLQRALILDPEHAGARYNMEMVLRRLAAGDDPAPRSEPSAYARRVKAEADALIAQRIYRQALDLLDHARVVDSSVEAYDDYIERLREVVGLEESTP
jgi:Tfp pilus assembly protein PilF